MPDGELGALIEFLVPYPSEIQKLALEARGFLQALFPEANEIFYDANSAVCAGVTYTRSTQDCFANFAVYSDHVTLIFQYGVQLLDPEKRLLGGGKQVRHIRLQGMETLRDPYVLNLLEQASDQAKRPLEPMTPNTIVKVMAGKKRR